ncbi:hypothetical protein PO498_15270 [Klebsiella variicola]|uniref:hypothetical protein n=1 Tax=Klebsiella TaxID=570 RepID=UPI00115F1851|nr:hypothetical protein [Klebsiella variicola]HED1713358.1 hypothetical protein [Klebsiella variicola subsp. variicola]MBD0721940.1 hypothetical protein [Klebsiella variicola]MBY5172722.1 hypothetical protein [Klebsiella variicola]MBZ7205095.1 hypothetical protein [Klebsiella variicola]HCF8180486.1 hypothetical protein [Klebsiella variicola]
MSHRAFGVAGRGRICPRRQRPAGEEGIRRAELCKSGGMKPPGKIAEHFSELGIGAVDVVAVWHALPHQ